MNFNTSFFSKILPSINKTLNQLNLQDKILDTRKRGRNNRRRRRGNIRKQRLKRRRGRRRARRRKRKFGKSRIRIKKRGKKFKKNVKDFDCQTYMNNYRDLRKAFGGRDCNDPDIARKALNHWNKHGSKANRTYENVKKGRGISGKGRGKGRGRS